MDCRIALHCHSRLRVVAGLCCDICGFSANLSSLGGTSRLSKPARAPGWLCQAQELACCDFQTFLCLESWKVGKLKFDLDDLELPRWLLALNSELQYLKYSRDDVERHMNTWLCSWLYSCDPTSVCSNCRFSFRALHLWDSGIRLHFGRA